jgi:type I restriction enzyme S subunit
MNEKGGDIQNIHYGDILIKYGSILDCDKENIPFLNMGISVSLSNRTVQSGDIIIADTAEDNTVGKAIEVINTKGRKVVSGLHTIFIRPHAGLFAERYLGYFFNAPIYHNQLLPYIVGIKVSSISKKTIRNTIILRPCLEEQQAIAEALSDVDAVVSSLTKLINKKKNIKQGAMQELLTGRKRLEGFSGEWEIREFSEITKIINGGTPKTSVSEYWDGTIKWCTPTDITRCKSKYILDTEKKITQLGLDNSAATLLPKGALLFCSRATIGEVRIAADLICTNQGFKSLVANSDVSNEWLYYWLINNKNIFLEKAIGSTFLEISKKDIMSIQIRVPELEEQTAIASILSDMDAEIEALEQKLNKYKAIKQSMMQELLTGRIRLI